MLHTGEGPQQEAQLSLFFEAFETAALLVTVVLVTFVLCVANGCSNWLVGVVLTSAYLVVCQGFWSHKDEDPRRGERRAPPARAGALELGD